MSTVRMVHAKKRSGYPYAAAATATILFYLLGLAIIRMLFEALFPQTLWLGKHLPVLLLSTTVAISGMVIWRWLFNWIQARDFQQDQPNLSKAAWTVTTLFFPLVFNLAYLFNRQIDLQLSRFLLFTSLWMTSSFLVYLFVQPNTWRWLSILLLLIYLAPIYLSTIGETVGSADTFEFQVVVPNLGIVHPTGYPSYLLLTKLFTFIPINSVAWRVNLATATYGLIAVCLLYILGRRLTNWDISALLAAILFGLTPIFWSQSVEAEVYTLHALFVIASLLLMREIGDWRLIGYPTEADQDGDDNLDKSAELRNSNKSYTWTVLLAFVLGLSLTNHLTTVILLPPAILTILLAYRAGRYQLGKYKSLKAIIVVAVAFLLPLLLYAYLPLRWAAVNGEPMGVARFIDWVIGGRFQGALQLNAWLNDPTRYDILSRLFADQWRFAWTFVLILVGFAYLLLWQWRYALIVTGTWLGYTFYSLNYYVPDISVFLIPAQIIFTLWWLIGVVAALDLVAKRADRKESLNVEILLLMAGILPLIVTAGTETWATVDRSHSDGGTKWARSVLELPLPDEAAILADSDKFPPLYYLQQAEGLRSDLEIMVLPDEQAYRDELNRRVSAGQALYLARYLPGLEGSFHLNSSGPLTRVTTTAMDELPRGVKPTDQQFGSSTLVGYSVQPDSPYAEDQTAVTLYWRSDEPIEKVLQVYARWVGDRFMGEIDVQHPANNMYPTVAWREGEIVADFHRMTRPLVNGESVLDLQVALAPPFTNQEELNWQTVASVPFSASIPEMNLTLQRAHFGPTQVVAISYPDNGRLDEQFPVTITGYGSRLAEMVVYLTQVGQERAAISRAQNGNINNSPSQEARIVRSFEVTTPSDPGVYQLAAYIPGEDALCGWLTFPSIECILGQIEISGAPLPERAINFDDKIALLETDIAQYQVNPGDQLSVKLTWQAIGSMENDYTVFVQVLNDEDKIVAQVDSWPLQGTLATSRWLPGEIIEDPYSLHIPGDLPPGNYRLNIGWYLLETLRRLPVLDASGNETDDKVLVPGILILEP